MLQTSKPSIADSSKSSHLQTLEFFGKCAASLIPFRERNAVLDPKDLQEDFQK